MDYVCKKMSTMAFLSVLASYLLVFLVFLAAIVAAVFLGIGIYKLTHKNKMQETADVVENETVVEATEESN